MAFPVTGILDNTTRVDEDPLSNGGTWSNRAAVGPLRLVSNQIRDHDLATQEESYWNAAAFGPNCEVYLTVTREFQVLNSNYFYFVARLASPTGPLNCYYWQAQQNNLSANSIHLSLGVFVAGTFTSLRTTANAFTLAVADQVGLAIVGDTLTFYQNGTAVDSFTDTTAGRPTGAGLLAIGTNQTVTDGLRFGAFGGGTLVGAPVFLGGAGTGIYRTARRPWR